MLSNKTFCQAIAPMPSYICRSTLSVTLPQQCFFSKVNIHIKTNSPLTPNRSAILEYKQNHVPTSCKGQIEERESNVELTVARMGISRLFEAPVTSFS